MTICPGCNKENPANSNFCSICGYNFGSNQTGKLNPDTVLEGRYVIVKTIGQGGMGAVYLALDTRLKNMPVAVKEMSTRAVSGDLQAGIHGFEKEASMLISLKHNALPVIRDFFSREDNRWYLVMDFIEGHTLKEEVLQRGPIPEAEVANWAVQLCDILGYLHNCTPAIIFRDLKPDNIMLTPEGEIKLIDFGIARHFQSGNSADTFAYGSSGFAPPEQYGQNQTDIRSDIYALGATLHFLLTGIDPSKNPFRFDAPSNYMKVSIEMEKAIMQALELKPDNRPQTMAEFKKLFPRQSIKTADQPASKSEDTKTVSINYAAHPANEIPTTPLNTSQIQSEPVTAAMRTAQALDATVPVRPNPNLRRTVESPPGHTMKPVNSSKQTRNIVLIAGLLIIVGGAILIHFTEIKDIIFSNNNKTNTVSVDHLKTSNTPTEESIDRPAGLFEVGKDIPAGEYVIFQDNDFCQYEVLNDLSGDDGSIIEQGEIDRQGYIKIENAQYIRVDGGHLQHFPIDNNPGAVTQFNSQDLTQYNTYSNPRFGYVLQYPVFFIPKPDPANGDGRSFISPDGKTTITVWGSHSPAVQGKSPKEYYEWNLANTEGQITYKASGDTWYAMAGIQGDMSFYQKTFVNQDENTFLITMPTDQVDYYRGIIDVMEKQFKSGAV